MSGGKTQRARSRREGPGAFTLIELLVVISIIALLVALLLPVLHKSRQQAKAVVCQSRLHQWAVMIHQYTSEWDGWFFHTWGPPPDYGQDRPGRHWYQALRPYYVNAHADRTKMLHCPAKTLYEGDGWVNDVGYGLNAWLNDFGRAEGPGAVPHRDVDLFWKHVDQARTPSAVPVLLDFRMFYEGLPRATDAPREVESALGFGWMSDFCETRHGSATNGVFLDWSVRKIDLKELWTLKWHRKYNTAGPWTTRGGVKPNDWPHWMRRFKDY